MMRLLLSIGTIAAGLAWSGGYVQASELPQNGTTSQPFEIAQGTGSGGGSPGGGTTGGGMSSGNSSGMASGNTGSGNMNTGQNRPGGEMGMGSELGKSGR